MIAVLLEKTFFVCFIFLSSFAFCIETHNVQGKENITTKDFNIPVVLVKKREIADKKRYYGTIQADESRVYSISVRTDGFIEKLFIDKNYVNVAKDEALFSFYSPELIDAQSEFLATMQYHHSNLAKQKLKLLGVHAKEIAKLQKSRRILNKVTFYAPVDGTIFAKNFNIGSGVKKGDEVFKIVNLDSVWVIANVNQEDITFLQNHEHKALMQVEGYEKNIALEFDRIYPEITDNFLKVRFLAKNPDYKLMPNMFAFVFIQSSPTQKLVLPKNAVLMKNKKYFVFLEDAGEFLPQEIQARRILGSQFYEILDGLQEGDSVAKNALFILDSDAQNNGDFR